MGEGDFSRSRLTDTLSGVFLLILAMYGAYITQATGCQMQQWLTNHMVPRHILIFITIYFAIDFTSGGEDPLRALWESAVIYALFLLYSRSSLPFSVASFTLMCAAYLLGRFIKFYYIRGNNSVVSKLRMAQTVTAVAISALLVVGCALYLAKQREEHASDWSTLHFIFGKTNCDHQSVRGAGGIAQN